MGDHPGRLKPPPTAARRVLQVANVDFSLLHFVLPLMRALRDRGHEVTGAAAPGALLAPVRAEGFRVVELPLARSLSPRAHAAAFGALRALLRAEPFDVVHAHMPISGFLGRLAARAQGVPVIAYTCHGFLFNQPGPVSRRAASLAMELAAGRVTDRFLTVSEAEAADARRWRIHPNPIAVGNGRDPSVFRPDPIERARIRASLGVSEDRCVVVCVSRLVRHKGYPELLAAMRALDPELSADLWVVGERLPTDHGPSLEAEFEGSRLGCRLRRLGYRTDVASVLQAADIFALPSHFEGLPMSVIEAMLCGLPVVATDIRGPREQVVDGETGLLVPPAAVEPLARALSTLARDPASRRAFGAAGRTRALARYAQDAVLARTVEALGL